MSHQLQAQSHNSDVLPPGFVFLDCIDSTIPVEIRYATEENFTGRPVCGYSTRSRAVMTEVCARRLAVVQRHLLQEHGLSLVVYDAYRPRRAVEDFVLWSTQETDEKPKYCDSYPLSSANKESDDRSVKDVSLFRARETAVFYYSDFIDHRSRLFEKGYISKRSNHARGSTVDVTLIRATETLQPPRRIWRERIEGRGLTEVAISDCTMQMLLGGSSCKADDDAQRGEGTSRLLFNRFFPYVADGTVDMGTSFDLFHSCSHPAGSSGSRQFLDDVAGEECAVFRRVLAKAMVDVGGFVQSECEWWHFWLQDGEPFPLDEQRPEWGFDFPI
jgi:D-alanyl-D-alanine dipeptidase